MSDDIDGAVNTVQTDIFQSLRYFWVFQNDMHQKNVIWSETLHVETNYTFSIMWIDIRHTFRILVCDMCRRRLYRWKHSIEIFVVATVQYCMIHAVAAWENPSCCLSHSSTSFPPAIGCRHWLEGSLSYDCDKAKQRVFARPNAKRGCLALADSLKVSLVLIKRMKSRARRVRTFAVHFIQTPEWYCAQRSNFQPCRC